MQKNTEALVIASKKIGLEVNAEKTKYMVVSRDQNAGQNSKKFFLTSEMCTILHAPSKEGEVVRFTGNSISSGCYRGTSDAQNFDVDLRFLENLCTTALRLLGFFFLFFFFVIFYKIVS